MGEIKIWKGIDFNDNWRAGDTSKFDDLAPSWYAKRKRLKEDTDSCFEAFLNRLKRQHAIETGVVEKLYDLSEGITQTFIKEGFIESYISHNDTNIAPKKLMQHLNDHFEAMDFIFDLVKSARPLSVYFIKQLHALVTRNQEYTEAIDTLGNIVKVPLIKGTFKKHDNNPKRDDGKIFLYCPTIHVESEMEKLVQVYEEELSNKTSPIILAAWVHHAFTQIHPFQDGNGRVARLLASLILIKDGLLPFTVKRTDKPSYINALEAADNNEPQALVTFFATEQKKGIENALNLKMETKNESLANLTTLLNKKITQATEAQQAIKQQELNENRKRIFDDVYDIIGAFQADLRALITKEKVGTYLSSIKPDDKKSYWYKHQIIEYANAHGYYFNHKLPRGWFDIRFKLPTDELYHLIITVHHYGYENNVLAIGAFMEFAKQIEEAEDKKSIPINVPPFTVSLEKIRARTKDNLKSYLEDILKVGLTIIINEIV